LSPQSLNLYSYVANDPVNKTDSLGLDWVANEGGGYSYEETLPDVIGVRPQNSDAYFFNGFGATAISGGFSERRSAGGKTINKIGSQVSPTAPNNVTCSSLAAGQVSSDTLSSWASGVGTAASMTANWLAGTGATNYDFGPNSVQSQQMMDAYGLAQNVSNFLAGGASSGNQNFGLSGLFSTGLNPTAQFVGSYHWRMALSDTNLNITITNTTTKFSAFYHAPGLDPNPPTRTGWSPMGRINQTFHIRVPCP
jgi:hypothetical protein